MEGTEVTVILTARTRLDLLPVALAHLEIQTFPAARFEILLIEEVRTPGREEVLERYTAGAPVRTRYIGDAHGGIGAAWNRALNEAAGRWLLFLDDRLLAGPHLLEAHCKAQQDAGGACAIAGAVDRHPQLTVETVIPWAPEERLARFRPNQPLRFLDWRAWNLSLPRSEVIEAGGFTEDETLAPLSDIELAWRLEQAGLRGLHSRRACAYLWQPAGLEAERERQYAEGKAMPALLAATGSEMARERFMAYLAYRRRLTDALLKPFAAPACGMLAGNTRLFCAFCRPILRSAFRKGYQDGLAAAR